MDGGGRKGDKITPRHTTLCSILHPKSTSILQHADADFQPSDQVENNMSGYSTLTLRCESQPPLRYTEWGQLRCWQTCTNHLRLCSSNPDEKQNMFPNSGPSKLPTMQCTTEQRSLFLPLCPFGLDDPPAGLVTTTRAAQREVPTLKLQATTSRCE